MRKATYTTCILVAALLVLGSAAAFAAPATVKKSVQQLDNGNYLIKLVVTSTGEGIYAFELKDPKGNILDIYAPRDWCFLSDGELGYSRTDDTPITAKRSLEFIIHAKTADASFVWTFFGELKQIGKPEVL